MMMIDKELEKMLAKFRVDRVTYIKKEILKLDRLQRLDIVLWLIMCVYDNNRETQVALAKSMYLSFLKDQCPYCGGSNIVKDGFNNKGDQYYKCKECGKKFTIDSFDDIELPFRKED